MPYLDGKFNSLVAVWKSANENQRKAQFFQVQSEKKIREFCGKTIFFERSKTVTFLAVIISLEKRPPYLQLGSW